MQSFRCVIAHTVREINDAQRLRWQVYGEEERLLPTSVCVDGREIDDRDYRDDTLHFIVYSGSEPAGTVRLLQPDVARQRTGLGRFGLALESKCDLGALAAPGIVPAEVTRFCVLGRHRNTGAAMALFSAMHEESARRGITHWVAGANMQTDFAEDAALAWRVAREKKLVSPQFRAAPRESDVPLTPRRRPCYTVEQRVRALEGETAGLELPRTLALFARGMSARYLGPPVYDTYFDIFALPLVASLADITAQRASAIERRRRERPRTEMQP